MVKKKERVVTEYSRLCVCSSCGTLNFLIENNNMNIINRLRNLGPGALVSAAFIGPGTVTACTLAGANFGYTLLWALLFSFT